MTPRDVYVVRKQLYINDVHERALKARARKLGVSEAELVRRMLDGLLLDGEGGRGLAGAGAAEALEGFLEMADATPNNGATYTVIVENCSKPQGDSQPRDGTPRNDTPVSNRYAPSTPPGPVDRPGGIIDRTSVRRGPFTCEPTYLAIWALKLLEVALTAGREQKEWIVVVFLDAHA